MEAIAFVRQGASDALPEFFACGSCGAIYSPRIYAGTDDHRRNAARQAAENCAACTVKSPEDLDTQRAERRRREIASATEVSNLEECFSDDGSEFYRSVDDARDAGETGVFGAKFFTYRVDPEQIVAAALEGHHDEASEDELTNVNALYAAIDAFNAAQRRGSYEIDVTVWQRIRHDRTFAMIKPDATGRQVEDRMIADIEAAGFQVLAARRETLSRDDAEWLYREHSSKPHFKDLVDYTVSGEVVLLLLAADDDNAPARFRALMGPTDRTKAAPHTLRAKFAIGLRENSVHGSDGPASAIDEICRFFSGHVLSLPEAA